MKRRKKPLPLVVQANKQDVARALPPDRLKKRLKLAADVPVVAASAAHGKGVQETLALAMRVGAQTLEGVELEPFFAAFADGDTLFDHVLTFEDQPVNDEPIDVEELHIGAEEIEVDSGAAAAHLTAASIEELEARGRRATAIQTEPDGDQVLVPARKNGARSLSRQR
jgi:hypothetical protein